MKKFIYRFCLLSLLLLAGCGAVTEPVSSPVVSEPSKEPEVISAELADSFDEAIIEKIDEKKKQITFYNLQIGKSYTLDYDSSTGIKDKYQNELVVSQLEGGELVKVTFLKDERKVKNIWQEEDLSKEENFGDFEINRVALWMDIADERYAIHDKAVVLSGDKKLTLSDINEEDTLSVYAKDHVIQSIVIENMHGYVRLEGQQSFLGGWVEFNQNKILPVEEEMLVVLPSGHYDMQIYADGQQGEKSVDVLPGEETLVDVSDLVVEEEQKDGGVIFTISPSAAILKIDGKETPYDDVITLSYGVHQLIVQADGYKTITQYIRVGQEMANINIEMERSEADNSDSKKDKEDEKPAVSANSVVVANTGEYRVYIDAPENSQLYVDGIYTGMIPISFEKKKGTYTLSIRKAGYVTRSYTLDVDDEKKDVHYSFSELEQQTP